MTPSEAQVLTAEELNVLMEQCERGAPSETSRAVIFPRLLSTITHLKAQIATLVEAAEIAFNHIDEAMGDTDPDDEEDPLLLACQALTPFVGDDPDLPASATSLLERLAAAEAEIDLLQSYLRTAEAKVLPPSTVAVCEKYGHAKNCNWPDHNNCKRVVEGIELPWECPLRQGE